MKTDEAVATHKPLSGEVSMMSQDHVHAIGGRRTKSPPRNMTAIVVGPLVLSDRATRILTISKHTNNCFCVFFYCITADIV